MRGRRVDDKAAQRLRLAELTQGLAVKYALEGIFINVPVDIGFGELIDLIRIQLVAGHGIVGRVTADLRIIDVAIVDIMGHNDRASAADRQRGVFDD